jgi:hypothetical protein
MKWSVNNTSISTELRVYVPEDYNFICSIHSSHGLKTDVGFFFRKVPELVCNAKKTALPVITKGNDYTE